MGGLSPGPVVGELGEVGMGGREPGVFLGEIYLADCMQGAGEISLEIWAPWEIIGFMWGF